MRKWTIFLHLVEHPCHFLDGIVIINIPEKKKNPRTPSLDKSRRLTSSKVGARIPNPVLISLHCYIVAGSNMMKIKRRWEGKKGEGGGRQEGIKGRREGKEATYDKYFESLHTPWAKPFVHMVPFYPHRTAESSHFNSHSVDKDLDSGRLCDCAKVTQQVSGRARIWNQDMLTSGFEH